MGGGAVVGRRRYFCRRTRTYSVLFFNLLKNIFSLLPGSRVFFSRNETAFVGTKTNFILLYE